MSRYDTPSKDYEYQVLGAFRRLKTEAEKQGAGRILSLSICPWIMGYPHRIAALDRILTSIIESGSIWRASGNEIVNLVTPQLSRDH